MAAPRGPKAQTRTSAAAWAATPPAHGCGCGGERRGGEGHPSRHGSGGKGARLELRFVRCAARTRHRRGAVVRGPRRGPGAPPAAELSDVQSAPAQQAAQTHLILSAQIASPRDSCGTGSRGSGWYTRQILLKMNRERPGVLTAAIPALALARAPPPERAARQRAQTPHLTRDGRAQRAPLTHETSFAPVGSLGLRPRSAGPTCLRHAQSRPPPS